MALFVEVQVLQTQSDLLEIPLSEGLWKGSELLDQMMETAIVVLVRHHIPPPLHLHFCVDRQDMLVPIVQVFIFLQHK